jgi:hypothetical protein
MEAGDVTFARGNDLRPKAPDSGGMLGDFSQEKVALRFLRCYLRGDVTINLDYKTFKQSSINTKHVRHCQQIWFFHK